MINVIRNPLGHKLSDSFVTGEVTDSSGDALVTTDVAHGLSDGDYIYIDSNVGTYNGFRYVDSVSYTTFKIKESENGDYVPYKRDASISYQVSVLQHGVQCVHLPIVYELESTLSKNNIEEEDYTPNTVASFDDANGNTRIVLTGPLSDPVRLSKIELVGDGDLAGVYQIVQVLNGSEVVIDLLYDAGYSFDGYTVVRYYDNYSINVNIYAGLFTGHRWETEKPIRLLATLRLVPDENNKVLFSISEYLRSLIKTVNDLTIDTFPNNINFLTEFYIGYFESYDVSDGEEITTFEDFESLDSFIGQAVNAKNEFKNLYSGHLSDYVSEETIPAQWLTDFSNPIAVVGYFFDVSFYLDINGIDVIITINKQAGEIVTEEIQTIDNPGKGIIRVEITPEAGYDQFCIQASTAGVPGSTIPITLPDLDEWISLAGSGDEAWTTGVAPTVNIPGVFSSPALSSEYLYAPYAFVEGMSYTILFNYTKVFNSGLAGTTRQTVLAVLDSSFAVDYSESFTTETGANADSITFTAGSDSSFIAIKHITQQNVDITVNSVSGDEVVEAIPAQILTEQLCLHIIEECDSTLLGDLRELETGEFRLLE